jgi:hypothetical protein
VERGLLGKASFLAPCLKNEVQMIKGIKNNVPKVTIS